MTLIADTGKKIFTEDNVDLSVAGVFITNDAYDLGFFPEAGTGGARAVLVVTVILVFEFVDTGTTPALQWTGAEKTKFMDDYKTQCSSVWGEKHQLTTTNTFVAAKVAGVTFNIQTMETGLGATLSHSHWNVKCRKVSSPRPSFTRPGGGSATGDGDVELTNLDLTPSTPYGATRTRRTAVHEFGHILGYRDEYPAPAGSSKSTLNLYTTSHPGELESIMYFGETIYARHYTLFADWVSRQWVSKDPFHCKPNEWKVDGTMDMATAGL